MKVLTVALLLLTFSTISNLSQAQKTPVLKVKISVSPELKSSFIRGGRIILYLTRQQHKEPRKGFDVVVGVTPQNWDSSTDFLLDTRNQEVITAGTFKEFLNSPDQFYFQVLYKQNPDDGHW